MEHYDVFISHSSSDNPAVEYLSNKLRELADLNIWLDLWRLPGGSKWQDAVELGLKSSRSCAVFLGPTGLTPWQMDELRAAQLLHKEESSFHIVPVLLPGGDGKAFPLFVRSNFNWVDFRTGIESNDAFEMLVAGIKGDPLPVHSLSADDRCPFKGLDAFDEKDAEFFFGREIFVQQLLLEHLHHSCVLAVVGTSGAGKSSVVRAGLVPALRKAQPLQNAHILKMRPSLRPLEELAVALLPLLGPGRNRAGELHQLVNELRASERTLHLTLRAVGSDRCHLIIDQFEEAFTLCSDDAERRAFFNNLVYAVTLGESPLLIVLTMRSDFLSRCAPYREFNTLVCENLVQISSMSQAELHSAVSLPARKVGLRFEAGLVERILRDISGSAGSLPLLEHALLELWLRRENHILTTVAYEEIGGVQGSLARRAEHVYNETLTSTQQDLCRRLFLRLVTLGEGTEDTRRRAAKTELLAFGSDVEPLLLELVDARLLSTTHDSVTGQETVEVIHEALIRGWPRLSQWLNEDRDFHRFRQRLTEDVREWQRRGGSTDELYRGAHLAEAEEYQRAHTVELTSREQEFIQLGLRSRDAEVIKERRARRRLRMFAAGLALGVVAITALFFWAEGRRRVARSQELASRVRLNPDVDPVVLLRTAIDAVETSPTFEAEDALRIAIQSSYEKRVFLRYPGNFSDPDFSLDGRMVVTEGLNGSMKVWDAQTGREVNSMQARVMTWAAALSPDGEHLVTAAVDGTVQVWDTKSGRQIWAMHEHPTFIENVKFSSDGAQIITGSIDGTIIVSDLISGRELFRFNDGPSPGVAFNSAANRILSWSSRGARMPVIREGATGAVLTELHGASPITFACFSPDGKSILTYGDPGTEWNDHPTVVAEFWDSRTGKLQSQWLGTWGGFSYGAKFSPDSRFVVAFHSKTARVFDRQTGAEVSHFDGHSGRIYGAQFSPDGSLVLSIGEEAAARVWESASGQERVVLRGHNGTLVGAAFDRTGDRVFTWGADSTVWEWRSGNRWRDLSNREVFLLPAGVSTTGNFIRNVTGAYLPGNIGSTIVATRPVLTSQFLVFSSPSDRWFTVTGNDTCVQLWSAQGIRHTELGDLGGRILRFATNALFTHFAIQSTDGTLTVWESRSGRQRSRAHVDSRFQIEMLTAYGSLVWCRSSGEENTRYVLRSSSGSIVATIRSPFPINDAVLSPAGDRAVTIGADGIARLWNAATGQELAKVTTGIDIGGSCVVGPDGSYIAISDSITTARIYHTATARELATLRGPRATWLPIRFSNDGSKVLVIQYDGTAVIYEASTGRMLTDIQGKIGTIVDASFNANGSRIVTASKSGVAEIWDLHEHRLVSVLRGERKAMNYAAFSPDNRYVTTISQDGTIRVYYTRLEDVLALARQRVAELSHREQ